jgi:hypothetical protein
MSSALAPSGSNQGIHALDPDLPFLASEVAIDIDNLLSNNTKNLNAIKHLAERLKNSVEIGSNGNRPRSLMDPATLSILGEAVLKTKASTGTPKVEDLLLEANKIAEELFDANPQTDREGLERARNFCVALSMAAANYRKSIRDLRPSHPFRR